MEAIDHSLIIIEDEPLIAMMIGEIAEDLGWTVEGSACTEADGFLLLDSSVPKLALLDINLGLTNSFAIAASCRDRGIPVVFITGYMARDFPRECGDAPILAKPFSSDDLEKALWQAITRNSAPAKQALGAGSGAR